MFSAKTKDNLKNSSCSAKNDLHDIANQAGRKARGLFNHASEDFACASDKVSSEIRTNPVRSTAIALGVGLLVGALLRS